MARAPGGIDTLRPRSFDVICAGEPLWRAPIPSPGEAGRAGGSEFVEVTKMLTASGLHVAFAAVLEDDRRGRALVAEMESIGVDVGAVELAPVSSDLVVVDAFGALSGGDSDRGRGTPVEIPASWSSQVLLLSGFKPVTSTLAGFCRAARRARRHGTSVVLDLVGSLRDWNGHDPRLISMVLRDADAVRCSLYDLAVIGTDVRAVRRAMKSSAMLVVDDDGGTTAVGSFGDVRVLAPRGASALAESCTAAICVEYARPRGVGETPAARWDRVLRREAPSMTACAPIHPRLAGRPARF